MKLSIRILFVILAIFMVWLGYDTFFPNPRKEIVRRLDKIARLASVQEGQGNFRRVANIEKLGSYFSEDVQVVVDIPSVATTTINGLADLKQAALAVKTFRQGLAVELIDPNIELNTSADSALVDLTLKAKLSQESDLIVQELKFTFKKTNGDWLVTHVETVKTLKP